MDQFHHTLWQILGLITLAGLIGGAINVLQSDHGFIIPKKNIVPQPGGPPMEIWNPGWLVNVLVGGIAALLSYLTTSELAKTDLFNPTSSSLQLPGSALASVLVIGIGGAKFLSSVVDKQLAQATNSILAGKPASPEAAAVSAQLALASPATALKMAIALPGVSPKALDSDHEFPFEQGAPALSCPTLTDSQLDNRDH